MDDLVSSLFEDSLNFSTNNLASNVHPRLNAYKKCVDFESNQEVRRKSILTEQKKKRSSLTNSHRNLEKLNEIKSFSNKNSPTQTASKSKSQLYDNQLMFSEWFEESPEDFDTNWIMVICPVGKRCLVVAMDGITTVYNKTGKQICKHLSQLPGGSKFTKTDYTILDCVFNYELQAYFVLDILVYKSHPVMDSDTEFRFFWLKCKLDEAADLDTKYYGNPYRFKDLPRCFKCTSSLIQSHIDNPFNFETDGILFYHKETHYTPGHTPLVLWLKHYMLPEILEIPIPNWIRSKIPSDYKGFKNAINISNLKQKKIEKYLTKSSNKNEVVNSEQFSSNNNKILESMDQNNQSFQFNETDKSPFTVRHFNKEIKNLDQES